MKKKFKDFLNESSLKKDTIVITFGRFNPPTTGHEKLFNKIKEIANRNKCEHAIFISKSYDSKKNPLKFREKLEFLRTMFPKINFSGSENIRTIFEALHELNEDKNIKNVILVVGGDRVKEFDRSISPYIGPDEKYQFNSFEVVSAGERNEKAKDVSGMSASKLRAAASQNNFDLFQSGLPKHFRDKEKMFKAVRRGMGLMENYRKLYWYDNVWFSPGDNILNMDFGYEGKVLWETEDKVVVESKDGIHKDIKSSFIIQSKLLSEEKNNYTNEMFSFFMEDMQLLREPEVLEKLVQKLIDKGMDKDKAWAVATSQLQKAGVLKKGTHDLKENAPNRYLDIGHDVTPGIPWYWDHKEKKLLVGQPGEGHESFEDRLNKYFEYDESFSGRYDNEKKWLSIAPPSKSYGVDWYKRGDIPDKLAVELMDKFSDSKRWYLYNNNLRKPKAFSMGMGERLRQFEENDINDLFNKEFELIELNEAKVSENQAYWISPTGKIIETGITHINQLINNPEVFGLTKQEIKSTYEKYDERMGIEGQARDELMISAMERGWLRIRKHGSNEGWSIEYASKLNKRKKDYIWTWAKDLTKSGINGKKETDLYAPVKIMGITDRQIKKTNMTGLLDDVLFNEENGFRYILSFTNIKDIKEI